MIRAAAIYKDDDQGNLPVPLEVEPPEDIYGEALRSGDKEELAHATEIFLNELYKQKKYERYLSIAEEAYARDPDSVDCAKIGEAAYKSFNDEKAFEYFGKVPDDRWQITDLLETLAYIRLLLEYHELKDGVQKALGISLIVIDRWPERGVGYFYAAASYTALGETEQAKKMLNGALKRYYVISKNSFAEFLAKKLGMEIPANADPVDDTEQQT